jgi:hypothetical protein
MKQGSGILSQPTGRSFSESLSQMAHATASIIVFSFNRKEPWHLLLLFQVAYF